MGGVFNCPPVRAFDTDVSKTGWVFFSEDMNRGKWSPAEQELHINILELGKICNTNILQLQKGYSSPCANSISLFSKNGDTKNLLMIQWAKRNMRVFCY